MAIPPLDGVVMIAGEKVKLALTTLTCVLVFLVRPLLPQSQNFDANQSQGVAACVYRVAFHPLAKYPGPFLAKFTNLYAGYHAWTGDIHEDVYRCHLKYGQWPSQPLIALSWSSHGLLMVSYKRLNC